MAFSRPPTSPNDGSKFGTASVGGSLTVPGHRDISNDHGSPPLLLESAALYSQNTIAGGEEDLDMGCWLWSTIGWPKRERETGVSSVLFLLKLLPSPTITFTSELSTDEDIPKSRNLVDIAIPMLERRNHRLTHIRWFLLFFSSLIICRRFTRRPVPNNRGKMLTEKNKNFILVL